MKYAGILLLAVAAVTTAALAAFGPLAPAAEATIPPTCVPTPTPGIGTGLCEVSATLPGTAPLKANGVCINCGASDGQNNSASLTTNAAGCAAVTPTPVVPVVGAGGSKIWADWPTSCVAQGDTVVIDFKAASGKLTVETVKWNLSDNSVIDGTGKIVHCHSVVGGVAELPDAAGSSGPPWALIAGIAAAVLVLGAGALYARRRLS